MRWAEDEARWRERLPKYKVVYCNKKYKWVVFDRRVVNVFTILKLITINVTKSDKAYAPKCKCTLPFRANTYQFFYETSLL